MAEPTPVNGQITDSVTQANVKVLGDAPAIALGTLYQTAAQSLSIAMQNAVVAQQNASTIAQAATAQGVVQIYSIDTVHDAVSIEELLGQDDHDEDD